MESLGYAGIGLKFTSVLAIPLKDIIKELFSHIRVKFTVINNI